ncbi:MAG: hypothetical protein AB7S75_22005 [Desulfococcaceae bacterium]
MKNADVKFLAKAGMTLSLAALVFTGAEKGYSSRQMHTWAGIALIGFSVWHYNVYQKPE